MLHDVALHVLVAWQRLASSVRDEEGQTLAEYGLIMAVIAVAVVVLAGVAFRDAIVGAFDNASACLETGGDENPAEGCG
jgi:Flp pilus assembly pilin Flp